MSGNYVNFGVFELYCTCVITAIITSDNFCASVLLQALSRAMSGNYVNFGVFELYGDAALSDALGVALRMALSIPLADIMSYKWVLFMSLFVCYNVILGVNFASAANDALGVALRMALSLPLADIMSYK